MNNLYIKKIILNNFRCHKNLELQFDNLNVLIGENGSGKSSILEGICYGLFGSVANGAKKNELIRYGAKTGGVTLILSNNYKIVRDLSNSAKLLNDKDQIITEKVSEIESYLNMDKNVFMNILYASQHDIYSYFIKFNAKEKDFIDSIFNLDNLTDKISIFLKDSVTNLLYQQNQIESILNTINNIEKNIKSILNEYNFDDINALIRAVDVAKSNFDNILKQQKIFEKRKELIYNIQYQQSNLESLKNKLEELNKVIINSDSNIEEAKNKLLEFLNKISNEMQYKIDPNNLEALYNMMNNNTNINIHLNNIKMNAENGLKQTDIQKVFSNLNNIIQSVNIITLLDQYRTYYQNIKETIISLQRNIDIAINSKSINNNQNITINNDIDKINKFINKSQDELNQINDIIKNQNIKDFSQITLEQQNQYVKLNTTLNNILSQQKQLDDIKNKEINSSIDIKKINKIIESINKISPIFSRDGFVSYLRKSLLKEIGTNIGESLEKFGFTKLIPVTIDEKSGALLFHNRPFKSLSGGEKTIAAILLRVLYARLLAPSMRINLLILDEPTADLDSIRVGYLRSLLFKLNQTLGLQILVVTHDSECIPENSNIININENI